MSLPSRAELIETVTRMVLEELARHGLLPVREPLKFVPVGVSARHVHITREHFRQLFGEGRELTRLRDLTQPGQFAAQEQVTLIGPKGSIEKVRILGPYRRQTQVELAPSDARRLGIAAPIRRSGHLDGTPGITLVGPHGTVELERGVIIADRHIHMSPADAAAFGVVDGQEVRVKVEGPRGGVLDHVFIRVREDFALEMHIDVDDANAFSIATGDRLEIIRDEMGSKR